MRRPSLRTAPALVALLALGCSAPPVIEPAQPSAESEPLEDEVAVRSVPPDPCDVDHRTLQGKDRAYVVATYGSPRRETLLLDVRLDSADIGALNAVWHAFRVGETVRFQASIDGIERVRLGDHELQVLPTIPHPGHRVNVQRALEIGWGAQLADRLRARGIDTSPEAWSPEASTDRVTFAGRVLEYQCRTLLIFASTSRLWLHFDANDHVEAYIIDD